MNKNRQINLLISPVNFKKGLEASEESLYLIEGTLDAFSNDLLLFSVKAVLIDP